MNCANRPSDAALATLSEKEREVLLLVSRNFTSKEIARELDLSPSGVDYRVDSARTKLGASTRLEAARVFVENCESLPVEPFTVHTNASNDDESDRGLEEAVFRFGDAETYQRRAPWTADSFLSAPEWDPKRLTAWQKLTIIGGLAIALNVIVILMLAVTEGIMGVVGS